MTNDIFHPSNSGAMTSEHRKLLISMLQAMRDNEDLDFSDEAGFRETLFGYLENAGDFYSVEDGTIEVSMSRATREMLSDLPMAVYADLGVYLPTKILLTECPNNRGDADGDNYHADPEFYCECKDHYCNRCDKAVEPIWVDDSRYRHGKRYSSQKPQCPHCEEDIDMWMEKTNV